jgi:hypothetical protein
MPLHKNGVMIRRTVENGTSEEHQELDEQVLLVGGDLVPAKLLATRLNVVRGDTLANVGGKPFLGHDSISALGGLLVLLPELQKRSAWGDSRGHRTVAIDEPAMTSSSGCWRGWQPAPPAERAWDPGRSRCTSAERCTRRDPQCCRVLGTTCAI